MANFLDLTTGLPALWAKIKSKFYTKAEVDALIPEDEVMWVNITTDGDVLLSDKTFSEITTHINNGGTVFVKRNDDIYTFSYMTSTVISFSCVYSYDGNGIAGLAIDINQENTITKIDNVVIQPSNNYSPDMDGTATVGGSAYYARADHVHPTDTSRAAVADVLTKTNTTSYTPTANYHPATKKYVDDTVAAAAPTCATTDEIEEMCDALGFRSVTINTSDYQERSGKV